MSNKIAIISTSPIAYSPFISFYEDILKKIGFDYIIINKELEGFEKKDNQVPFIQTKQILKKNFIVRTILWWRFVKKQIKKHKCNRFIVTPTRTAIVLFPILVLKYNNKYVFDIRDFTKENKFIYKFLEKKIIKNSLITILSSSAFLKWIPYKKNNKFSIVHNIPFEYKVCDYVSNLKTQSRIKIGYIGMVDYEEQNLIMAEQLENSSRYQLVYYGSISKSCNIKKRMIENNIKQPLFMGKFNNSEKPSLYRQIDFVNAVYGYDTLITTTALPNKLYDCAIFKKPIIVSANTYLSEIVQRYDLGFAFDHKNDNLLDALDDYLRRFDENTFKKGCDKFLHDVKKEQDNTINRIKAALES